jgi:hypothetical protein
MLPEWRPASFYNLKLMFEILIITIYPELCFFGIIFAK